MTNTEKVRLYIGGSATTSYITNTQIDAILSDVNSDVYMAAYRALMALAANKAFNALRVKTLTYESEDKSAKALQDAAQMYKELSESAPAAGYAEQALSDANIQQIIINRALRGS